MKTKKLKQNLHFFYLFKIPKCKNLKQKMTDYNVIYTVR